MKKILFGLLIFSISLCLIPTKQINAQTVDEAQWKKIVQKYTKSADTLMKSCDKMIAQINGSLFLSSDGKAKITNEITTIKKDKIDAFKTSLTSENPPQLANLKNRQTELSTSIKDFKTILASEARKVSYVKTLEKLVTYSNKSILIITSSTYISSDEQSILKNRYTDITKSITEYLETLPGKDTSVEFAKEFKIDLYKFKEAIKNINTRFSIDISTTKFKATFTKLKAIFSKLTVCTNTDLKNRVEAALNDRNSQIEKLNNENTSNNYTNAKALLKDIKNNFRTDINLLKNLGKNCTSTSS